MGSVRESPLPPDSELARLAGVVETVTFHNPETGWTVLKVAPFDDPTKLVPVVIHQAKVFAGATMEFSGTYTEHPKHGRQFKAVRALERKPATTAALEKYLGSGLIKGVGPAIAERIVKHFRDQTLEVFEHRIEELLEVPGIAEKKLEAIRNSWAEHRAIRDVMIFLQGYGISTLFATKIFKAYGDRAIEIVERNPYRLAHDIYGIGFFSADRIALAMGFERDGIPRLEAGIKHVLASSREDGHCFLTEDQIVEQVPELLREPVSAEKLKLVLGDLLASDQIKARSVDRGSSTVRCLYSKGLYFDELRTAQRVSRLAGTGVKVDAQRVDAWVAEYTRRHGISLSDEQAAAVQGIVSRSFSILTGGPGCGKTTTTRVLVALLRAMNRQVLLAAPTGRAAQRMTEVIGSEAKTIHRLLGWLPTKGGFKHDANTPLECDFLIVDEASMLDISLASALLSSVPNSAQVLLIGDPDQLPAVGAGDVLADLLRTPAIPRFALTKVFRQAEASSIIRFAHEINRGLVPKIHSPIARTGAFHEGHDCLFVDADEATKDQIHFIQRARAAIDHAKGSEAGTLLRREEEWVGRLRHLEGRIDVDPLYRPDAVDEESVRAPVLSIPEKFRHVDLAKLAAAETGVDELLHVLKGVHPWSTIHYGLTAQETLVRLYTKTIPEWLGEGCEIQVLTPQVRGTLGTQALNECLQQVVNPESKEPRHLKIGDKTVRVGDRVIQTRNNYDLGVYNGDIGRILGIDMEQSTCEIEFTSGGERRVHFERDNLVDLALAYAITVHKSQGSEFGAVILPVLGQHYNMLFRNLVYTGLTRAKKLAVFVGTRRALAMAIQQVDNRKRQTTLADLIAS